MNKTESQISREIDTFLTDQGYTHWRNQSGHLRVKGGYMRFGINGLADRTVMLKGKHLYIEVKTETGKQREAQEGFQASCKALGHQYLIARSVKDVRDKLKSMGEL